MPPKQQAEVNERVHADGTTVTFHTRVRAYGGRHRIVFGTNVAGWSRERAEIERDKILRDIDRGVWIPPDKAAATEPAEAAPAPTFHEFASVWWPKKRLELGHDARKEYKWRLDHLLRKLHRVRMDEFTTTVVDDYRSDLLREREALQVKVEEARRLGQPLPSRRPLSARSINMTIDLLAQMLERAKNEGWLTENPARGKDRRVKREPAKRNVLEPDMVVELLDAAGEWERSLPAHQRYGRRALLAGLALAGGRISEGTEALRSHLDIHGGIIVLGKKTEAGTDREVDLTAFLADEWRAHLATLPAGTAQDRGALLFPSRTGGRLNASNIRNRLLINEPPDQDGKRWKWKKVEGERVRVERGASAVERVNDRRAVEGRMLLPERVTPHTFRRTFATLALLAGRDARMVMAWLGHSDARFTLSVYNQVVRRQRVDYDLVWHLMRFANEPEQWPGARRVANLSTTASGPFSGPPVDGPELRVPET